MDAASVDAIVTDPPYGLEFMGNEWDKLDALQLGMQEWHYQWAVEALRVAKPGCHLLAFGGTRTFHRLACAVEDAGWEIRDCLMYVYGSGFPKSHNLKGEHEGWGTALKPAWEPIIMARKPLEGTVAENVEKWGCGAINVDGCRVGTDVVSVHNAPKGTFAGGEIGRGSDTESYRNHQGRWPANLIHDGSDEVLGLFPQTGPSNPSPRKRGSAAYDGGWREGQEDTPMHGDSGSAARFFYAAKSSRAERGEGNNHPTVKPLALMRYLCRLVTPPNGVVLDHFAGSGSTLIAAKQEGLGFIGIEKDASYCEISERRLAAYL